MARLPPSRRAALVVALIVGISLSASVYAQDAVPVRINCGNSEPITLDGVAWLADTYFDGGRPYTLPSPTDSLSASLSSPVEATLRAFPPDASSHPSSSSSATPVGGCYNVPLVTGARYMVRVGVAYRNYDGLSSPPFFNLLINGLLLRTLPLVAIEPQFPSSAFYTDYLVYALEGSISVCFSPFIGATATVPLVNSLEFLPVNPDSCHATDIGTDAILASVLRVNFGGPAVAATQDPGFRTWAADPAPGRAGGGATSGLQQLHYDAVTTGNGVEGTGAQAHPDDLPLSVFQSARVGKQSTPGHGTGFVYRMDPQNPLHLFLIRLHFAEIEGGVKVGERRFDIKLAEDSIFGHGGQHQDEDTVDQQGVLWPKGFDIMEAANGSAYRAVTVPIFFNYTVYAENYGRELRVWLGAMADSVKLPLLNGVEVYEITRTPRDGYVYRGMTPSDLSGIIIASVLGAAVVVAVAWVVVARYTPTARQYAIFGASKQHRTGL